MHKEQMTTALLLKPSPNIAYSQTSQSLATSHFHVWRVTLLCLCVLCLSGQRIHESKPDVESKVENSGCDAAAGLESIEQKVFWILGELASLADAS